MFRQWRRVGTKLLALIAVISVLIGCGTRDIPAVDTAAESIVEDVAAVEAGQGGNSLRDAFFGELHVHTGLSFDAYVFGVRVSPEQSYRYAQ